MAAESDDPIGPVQQFLSALGALWRDADRPTTRALGERAGVPSSTVHNTLSGASWPRWESASAIIEALGGDPAAYPELWARGDAVRRKPTTLTARSASPALYKERQAVTDSEPSADARLIADALRELAEAIRGLGKGAG